MLYFIRNKGYSHTGNKNLKVCKQIELNAPSPNILNLMLLYSRPPDKSFSIPDSKPTVKA